MSVLASQEQAELTQLLQALQSADNNVRAQAEEHLANNWTNAKPEMLLMGLVEQIRGSTDTTVSSYKIFPFAISTFSCIAGTTSCIG